MSTGTGSGGKNCPYCNTACLRHAFKFLYGNGAMSLSPYIENRAGKNGSWEKFINQTKYIFIYTIIIHISSIYNSIIILQCIIQTMHLNDVAEVEEPFRCLKKIIQNSALGSL